MTKESNKIPWMELDSHPHMAIIGKHCHVLASTGKSVEVNAFTPNTRQLVHHQWLMMLSTMTHHMMVSHTS